jgi:hypothetical protein
MEIVIVLSVFLSIVLFMVFVCLYLILSSFRIAMQTITEKIIDEYNGLGIDTYQKYDVMNNIIAQIIKLRRDNKDLLKNTVKDFAKTVF